MPSPSSIASRPALAPDHPLRLAQQIAQLLDSDPIAAGQVKEHISAERLTELLEIDPPRPDPETFADMVDESVFDEDDALEFVLRRFNKTEILEAVNKQ